MCSLRIRIEIPLPLPAKMGWQHFAWRTNNEPRCKGFKVKRQSFTYFGVVQSKQLSNNDLAVVDLDAVVIICAETWSKIHGIQPWNTMTVGDVDQTLCKQKEAGLLICDERWEKHVKSGLDLPFPAHKVRTFRNYHLCVYFNLTWVKSCGAC